MVCIKLRLLQKKEYLINSTKLQKKFYVSLHYNRVNSYILFKSVELYKFKLKDSEINAALLCLGNASKDFLLVKMKKTELSDMSIIFQLIMIVLMFMIFWIFKNI